MLLTLFDQILIIVVSGKKDSSFTIAQFSALQVVDDLERFDCISIRHLCQVLRLLDISSHHVIVLTVLELLYLRGAKLISKLLVDVTQLEVAKSHTMVVRVAT